VLAPERYRWPVGDATLVVDCARVLPHHGPMVVMITRADGSPPSRGLMSASSTASTLLHGVPPAWRGGAEALERQTSFDVIEIDTDWKLDLIMRRDRPFSRVELGRRIPVRLLDTEVLSFFDPVYGATGGRTSSRTNAERHEMMVTATLPASVMSRPRV